jgi:hypothetical protein
MRIESQVCYASRLVETLAYIYDKGGDVKFVLPRTLTSLHSSSLSTSMEVREWQIIYDTGET